MRRVLEVGEERDRLTVRGPARCADGGARRRIDRRGASGARGDDVDRLCAAGCQSTSAIGLRVYLEAGEVVPCLAEVLNCRHTVDLCLEEVAPIRALVVERDVL